MLVIPSHLNGNAIKIRLNEAEQVISNVITSIRVGARYVRSRT